MKVILLEDIKGVGKKDQIINANDGYAKNFLFPKKLAVEANKNNMNALGKKQAAHEAKLKEEFEQAKEFAKKLEEISVEIKVKLGDNGKLFGSVTNKEISIALKEQFGFDVDKKKIVVENAIKTVGEMTVEVKLHTKVTAKLKVCVNQG